MTSGEFSTNARALASLFANAAAASICAVTSSTVINNDSKLSSSSRNAVAAIWPWNIEPSARSNRTCDVIRLASPVPSRIMASAIATWSSSWTSDIGTTSSKASTVDPEHRCQRRVRDDAPVDARRDHRLRRRRLLEDQLEPPQLGRPRRAQAPSLRHRTHQPDIDGERDRLNGALRTYSAGGAPSAARSRSA